MLNKNNFFDQDFVTLSIRHIRHRVEDGATITWDYPKIYQYIVPTKTWDYLVQEHGKDAEFLTLFHGKRNSLQKPITAHLISVADTPDTLKHKRTVVAKIIVKQEKPVY